ncbi:MAG: hypothetical protein LDL07_14470 [Desulfarculus sp.]|nr:hypothetical protein [Desulfarculus sp.]
MKRIAIWLSLCLLVLGCAGPGPDQGPGEAGPGLRGRRDAPGRPRGLPESLDEYLSLLRQRLHLTPEQESQVVPALRAELDKKSEIRKRYQYSDPREAAQRMAQEERQVHEETLARLAEVLSPTQLDVLRKLQEEGVKGPDGPAGRGGGGPGRGKGPGMMN